MKILLLNQCFHPDVMATGQYLTQLASALTERGHEVTVITSNRGYDDPHVRYASRESWKGITILRVPSLSLGKETRWRRAVNFGSFSTTCFLRMLLLGRFDVVVALTSPPLISFLGALFVRLRGGRFCFWVMDLNPDEAIAAGWLSEHSATTQLLQRALSYSLRHAEKIVVLDRFMKERVLTKGIDDKHVFIVPPWSYDDTVKYDFEEREAFRSRFGAANKFVVMYSGNHSPCHPLDTLLEAARALKEREEFVFYFVGGGSEHIKVRQFGEKYQLDNIKCLPYQPLNQLSGSLSAADLHVVVMGPEYVGLVHPCKIYNILGVGGSVLYIGPEASHIEDLARQEPEKFSLVRHGNVAGVVDHVIRAYNEQSSTHRKRTGTTNCSFAKRYLLPELVSLIESATRSPLAESLAPSVTTVREI